MKAVNFYLCPHCGNIAMLVEDHKVPMFCCGQKMEVMQPNTTEAAFEKHLPVITLSEGAAQVTVGDVLHPATAEHHIGWLYLATNLGGQYRKLDPLAAPTASFALVEGETVQAAYGYCNLHGLWVTEA